MKIAISTDNGQVSAHFGRCPSFTIANIENDRVKNKKVIDNPGHHPGFLPEFLSKEGVSCIIAGGMGHRAQDLFNSSGIKTVMGVSGNVDDIINQFVKGTLTGGDSLCKPGGGRGYGLDRTGPCHKEENDH